ncbi:MAG TPA: glycosyltransferase family 2 protein [Tepidisphaeraceae bacterium]|nr:glycosyltransferase family 2 protein [Tepidisphaeraceae bacterium]
MSQDLDQASNRRPRVSIGMPVRNGHRFIRQALDSLLAQTFTDFEIVICDNASTDQTEQICREYMARDSRVRYFRNSTNLGPAGNHNKCFNLSRGEYFRWHAHDDMCHPEYLSKCVELLDGDPSIVVAYPKVLIVDEVGAPLEQYDFHPDTDGPDPARRFGALVLINHRKHRACEIFGLMRSSALTQTPLEGAYARGDSVLLARMALLGRMVEYPERYFLSRSHTSQSMQTLPTASRNGRSFLSRVLGTGPLPPPEWWDASRKGKANFPEWNLFKEYWISIARTENLSAGDRIRCYGVMLRWLVANVHKLARDLVFAAETVISRIKQKVVASNWRDAGAVGN